MLTEVHHIAFAVRDLEAGIALFRRLTGREVHWRGPVTTRGAEVAVFVLDNMNIEVVSPTDPEGSLSRHIDERGEGFFHMAFAVDDVDRAHTQLQAEGLGFRGEPYVAFRDWRIAYLDPSDTAGIPMHIIARDAS